MHGRTGTQGRGSRRRRPAEFPRRNRGVAPVGGQGGRLLRKQLLRNPRKAVVPFHRQSFDFTCGPACLIMAMRHFEPALASGRELEVALWREATLGEAYASSRQGLALAAHRRGFSVRTQGNAETIELADRLGLDPSLENRKAARAPPRGLKRRGRQEQIPAVAA